MPASLTGALSQTAGGGRCQIALIAVSAFPWSAEIFCGEGIYPRWAAQQPQNGKLN